MSQTIFSAYIAKLKLPSSTNNNYGNLWRVFYPDEVPTKDEAEKDEDAKPSPRPDKFGFCSDKDIKEEMRRRQGWSVEAYHLKDHELESFGERLNQDSELVEWFGRWWSPENDTRGLTGKIREAHRIATGKDPRHPLGRFPDQ